MWKAWKIAAAVTGAALYLSILYGFWQSGLMFHAQCPQGPTLELFAPSSQCQSSWPRVNGG